jgi:hypothetical protein
MRFTGEKNFLKEVLLPRAPSFQELSKGINK